jgi:hypothetical protein
MRTPYCIRTPWSFTPPPDPVRDREAHRALHQLRQSLARSAFLGRSLRPRRRYASPGLLLWCRRMLGWHEANLLHRWVLPLCGTLLWYLKNTMTQPCQRQKAGKSPSRKQKRQPAATARRHSSASPGPGMPALPLTLESAPAPPPPPQPAPASSIEAKPDFFCQYPRRTNRSTGDAKASSRSRARSVALIVEAKPIPIVSRRAVPRSAEPSSAGRTRQHSGGLKKRAEMAERPGRCSPQAMPSTPEVPVTASRQRRLGTVSDEASPVRSRRPVEPSSARFQRSAVGSSWLSPELSREHDETRKRRKTEESRYSPLSAGEKLQMRLQELICQAMSGNRRSQKELIRSIVSMDQDAKSQRRSGRRAEKKRESWEALAELPRRRKLTKPPQHPPSVEPAPSSKLTESPPQAKAAIRFVSVPRKKSVLWVAGVPREPGVVQIHRLVSQFPPSPREVWIPRAVFMSRVRKGGIPRARPPPCSGREARAASGNGRVPGPKGWAEVSGRNVRNLRRQSAGTSAKMMSIGMVMNDPEKAGAS